ncbi:MAG: alpha-galactosidase [Ruminococcaceae bacterium]|nr:alpha-galactosidase [Oscillospiraceae bacterium]
MKIRSLISLILAVLMLLPLAACGGGTAETETHGESETEALTESTESWIKAEPEEGYLSLYGDYKEAAKWLKENVEDKNAPPVSFTVGGVHSDTLKWSKEAGDVQVFVDYPESDMPVERRYFDIVYTCAEKGLKLTLTLTGYDGYPLIEYSAVLENISNGKSENIKDIKALDTVFEGYGKDSEFHYTEGGKYAADAYEPHAKKISDSSKFTLGTDKGLPTDEYIPFFNIAKEKGGIISVINWQGSWKIDYESKNGELEFTAGQRYTDFVLLEGESVSIPGVVLIFYKDGDWQFGQNIWRRWIVEHNLFRNSGRRDFKQNVFLSSSLEGAQRDMAVAKRLVAAQINKNYNLVFEIDAGWYIYGQDGWYSAGNYNPNSKYNDGGLEKLSELCRENGMSFCLWMEPERAYYNTLQSKDLKDNMIYLTKDEKYISFMDCKKKNYYAGSSLINYGKQEAIDYVVELVSSTVKKYGMDVYRQDFNVSYEKGQQVYFAAYDKYEEELYGVPRTGITENHACAGYVEAWTRIAEENPGLIFDSCSGGGRRNDLETMRFSFMHTKSDWFADVVSQQCQNFGAYSWYIFTGTGICDYFSTYDIRSRLTLSNGVPGGTNIDYKIVANGLKEWESLQTYMFNDFYQISEYDASEKGNLAMQFNDHENGEGMMIAYLRAGGEYTFIAKGLDPNKEYRITDRDKRSSSKVMTGAALMSEGFTVSYPKNKPYAAIADYAVEI